MQIIETGRKPIYAWVDGVEFDPSARAQLQRIASLPILHHHAAAMPDVHVGIGATVGSVIPTLGAIVPAAVGVDIGCGMSATRTTLRAQDLPDDLKPLRAALERAIPVGAESHKHVPASVETAWGALAAGHAALVASYPKIDNGKAPKQLGTLGGGNHFIEVTIDEEERVWLVLHSGSRGIGNRIGTHFIALARQAIERKGYGLPDKDLAWLDEADGAFADYVRYVEWAQLYAKTNRDLMMSRGLDALRHLSELPTFGLDGVAVNCHHNYVAREHHFGRDVFLTRKGAVRAGLGELGIIPGSMGARTFIVRGKGNPDSFESCSHGAGRRMGRGEAKRRYTVDDLADQTRGVECRKDAGVIDEIPAAYKNVDDVMRAQADLVDIVHEMKQVVCIKG